MSSEAEKFTVGADPEVLLYDTITKAHVSAIGFIGGSKHEPRRLGIGAVQEDNVMAEFNIPPAASQEELLHNLQSMLGTLSSLLKDIPTYSLTLSDKCAAHYNVNELRHPKAKEAGCDPDYNAWTMAMNPPPRILEGTLRTAGGHIHVGWDGDKDDLYITHLIRCMDVTLGLPSLFLDPDTERKKLYGKAGSFRPTSYGIEYRVLSNFWIFKPDLVKWAYEGVAKAFNLLPRIEDINKSEQLIRRAIDTGNKELARATLNKLEV